ncbi:MAG: hypothetical protein R3A52_17800 [Polyangiales bacterium]
MRFRDVLKGLGAEHTILLSTHILSEVEAVCTRVVIIHQGKVAASGPLASVRAELQGGRREVEVTAALRGKDEAVFTTLTSGIEGAEVELLGVADGVARVLLTVPAGDEASVETFAGACVSAGLGLRAITPRRRSLEGVFHELTTRDDKERAA